MRILLVGQAAFAEQVLQGLEAAGHEVAGVVCPPDRGDKLDPVKSAAIGRGIPTHQFPSLKTDQAREAFARADADLAILAYVTQIVPELGKRKNATAEKARRMLGWTPRSSADALVATAESLVQLGLLKDSKKAA